MAWTTIVLLSTLFRPAAAPDVSGSWAVMGVVDGNANHATFSATCTFQQRDDALDGVCKRASGDVDVSGHVTAQGVNFQYDIDNGNGATLTFLFNGTLDKAATAMTGAVSVSGFGEGTFTAQKQKK